MKPMEEIFFNLSEHLLRNSSMQLKYENFYLSQLLRLNSKLSLGKEEIKFKVLCNHHQAMTDTILEYTKNEINPKLDESSQLKNLFFTKLALDIYSPKNFPFMDLNFLKYCQEQDCDNFRRGFQNLLEDIKTGRLNFTDKKDFIIGETVACTEGKVVFKNHLFELLCYKPHGEQINSTPILIVPACINKYYILDLQQQNSLVKWLTENGYQVFMISWINPTHTTENYSFIQYITEGVNKAITTITEDFGFEHINITGYCLGGIFCAISASYFEGDGKIRSLSLLTTQLDFSEPNDFSIFLEPQAWTQTKQMIEEKGMMNGIDMQNFFNFIKSKEMIFQYVIDNYFYANPKQKIDFLSWNSDSTNLTPRFYKEYIEWTYIQNKVSNSLKIDGREIQFSQISIPSFILATVNDHIVPWEDAYRSIKTLTNSKKHFVLAGSGHVAGVINHPSKNKYNFWTNDDDLHSNHSEWKKKAQEVKGSWWPEWLKWLNTQDNTNTSSNYKTLPELSYAPGEYVKVVI